MKSGNISVEDQIQRYGGRFPESIVLTFYADDETLAHELGHVLLNTGEHFTSNPNNLMAFGLIRNLSAPPELEEGQCERMRRNPKVTSVSPPEEGELLGADVDVP